MEMVIRHPTLGRSPGRACAKSGFQQSFSSGWSGALKLPVGVEGGVSASAELSEQQLSYPDIVALLKEFLAKAAEHSEVRIPVSTSGQDGRRDGARV